MAELQDQRAPQLLGAAEALRERLGGTLEGAELALHKRGLAALALPPGSAAAKTTWATGKTLATDQAVELALDPVTQLPVNR